MKLSRGMWDWVNKLWRHKRRGRAQSADDLERPSTEAEELIRQRLAGLGYIDSNPRAHSENNIVGC